MAETNYPTVPGSGAPMIAGDPLTWRAQNLFADPNFQNLLAGIGAKLDPEGVGGAIGIPTQAYIANKAAQSVGAKTLAQGERLLNIHQQLINKLGGMTPSGTPGVTSAKVNASGSLTLEVDPRNDPNNVESLISDNASAYPSTQLEDMSGNRLRPKLGPESPLPDQVSDLLSPYMPSRPTEAPVNNAQDTGVISNAAQVPDITSSSTPSTPTQLQRPAQLALDSYRNLDAPLKTRINRGVDAALVQNPSLSRAELLSIIGIESHFTPTIQGPVTREGWRAAGLMQLSPGVLKRYAVSDPFNVEANINAGAAEYARLKAKYGPEVALAAYNAGEVAVAKYGGKVPQYPETLAYVQNVPALSQVIESPGDSPSDANSPAAIEATINPASSTTANKSPFDDSRNSDVTVTGGNAPERNSNVSDTAAQIQELISTASDTSGVRGTPRSNLITADDLRGLNPEQINAVVGRAQQNTVLATQIAELTGQTVREIRRDLNARQLEIRKAKLQAAKDISESSLSETDQKSALGRLRDSSTLESVLELAITAAGLPKASNVGADREAVSSELFGGRKYAQLQSSEQARVNTELIARGTSGSEVVTTEAGIFVVDKRTNTARQVTVAPGTQPVVGANMSNVNPTTQTTPSASSLTPGSPLPGKEPAKPTENQAKALNFGSRATAANSIIADLESRGEIGTSTTLAALESASRTNPLVATGVGAGIGGVVGGVVGGTIGIVGGPGAMLTLGVPGAKVGSGIGAAIGGGTVLLAEGIANRLRTPEQQQYFQAKADFVGAILRKESGAAINADEFTKEENRYFPRPGDLPEVIAQKARARDRALQSLERESGQRFLPTDYNSSIISPERQVNYYREHFKAIDAESANAELITQSFAQKRPDTTSYGITAYTQVYGSAPKYMEYAQRNIPESVAPRTPAAIGTLLSKIGTYYTPQIANGSSDAWLIALDGVKEQQFPQFTIPQRAAIRGRMKVLGLPRKGVSE